MAKLKWEGVALNVSPGQWYTVVIPTVRAVLLDENSNPVVGQECVITGPNGFRVRAFTDARGRVSVPAPEGEEYEITFVNLDRDVWDPAPSEPDSTESA